MEESQTGERSTIPPSPYKSDPIAYETLGYDTSPYAYHSTYPGCRPSGGSPRIRITVDKNERNLALRLLQKLLCLLSPYLHD